MIAAARLRCFISESKRPRVRYHVAWGVCRLRGPETGHARGMRGVWGLRCNLQNPHLGLRSQVTTHISTEDPEYP